MASALPAFPVNEDGWPLAPEGYVISVEVGQGAFAKVMRAYCPLKDESVALKVMKLENITTSLEEIQAEVRSMKLSHHVNVLDLLCCFVVKSDLWLVMPLMDKGSCHYVMRMLRKSGKLLEGQGLPEEAVATILREMLHGLEYIHGQHQIHRDIKAGNILLNASGRVVLADFGVAGWMSEAGARGEHQKKTFVGTP
jgi:serine/threonine-protein kinase OSR1/STK39